MNDIPDDVLRAARAVADDALMDVGFSDPVESDECWAQVSILAARAIMAERERCAAQVERLGMKSFIDVGAVGIAIRKGEA